MDQDQLDALTRALTGVPSRRQLLRGLAGAGVAWGVARLPHAAGAKKARNKKAKQQAATRCKRQGGPCRAFVAEGCASSVCAHFERCNAGAGLACLSGPVGQL